MELVASCPNCGEPISLEIDETGGASQEYVEDCSVCCRPIRIQARVHGDRVTVSVRRLED